MDRLYSPSLSPSREEINAIKSASNGFDSAQPDYIYNVTLNGVEVVFFSEYDLTGFAYNRIDKPFLLI